MTELELRFDSLDGVRELTLDEGRYTFGRGSDAEFRFSDDGLSRIHATIYSEAGNVWIVDEGSSNGTFVNGNEVEVSGTPLRSGDSIKIGHYTTIEVVEAVASNEKSSTETNTATVVTSGESEGSPSLLVPLSILGLALILIVGAIGIVGAAVYFNSDNTIANNRDNDRFENDYPEVDSEDPSGTPTVDTTVTPSTDTDSTNANQQTEDAPTNQSVPAGTPYPELPNKRYQQMSESEKRLYIKVKAERIAGLIGNRNPGEIPPDAVGSIKRWVDGYVRRFRSSRVDDCQNRRTFVRSDMLTVLERASKTAPFIQRSFRSQALDPQLGIYVAMIESEHCKCLQSGTGPLGMFQFTRATGRSFGLDTKSGASPQNPDERCEPEPAAKASAKYLKFLSGRIGTGPLSMPLAIASYNSGEGGLGRNLMTALRSEKGEQRSFWTLVANAEKLSKQFQHENIKYVPKFFAAAIVGENPRDFGASLQPLSTYTK